MPGLTIPAHCKVICVLGLYLQNSIKHHHAFCNFNGIILIASAVRIATQYFKICYRHELILDFGLQISDFVTGFLLPVTSEQQQPGTGNW